MSEINRIRVATDFSEEADNAVFRAARLATERGIASGTLVHALPGSGVAALTGFLSSNPRVMEELERSARELLEEGVERAEKETGFRLEPELVRSGLPEAAIGKGDEAQLIVVGGRGRSRVRDMLLGTGAEAVVRTSALPVLVVRNPWKLRWQRVMVPVDFSDDSRAALQRARELAPEASLTLIHAMETLPGAAEGYTGIRDADVRAWERQQREEAERQVDELLAACGLGRDDVELVIEHAYAPALVAARAAEWEADLIVVGKQGHSRLHRMLIGSVTSHVLRRSDTDVLVVPG